MADKQIPADWAELLADFHRRQTAGRAMGSPEKLAARKESGRLNVREIIDELLDQDSFFELGTLVGGVSYHGETPLPSDGIVGGLGRIDGRPVVVACEDFTIKGGSIGHSGNARRVRYARLAAQEKIPYILLLDGAGARATNALERHPYAPNDMIEIARLNAIAPTIAGVIGSSAGHGAISGLLMDFVLMTRQSTLFAAGPPLVAAATGEKVTKEELGPAEMHTSVSGNAHNLVENDQDLCAQIRRILSYLPANSGEAAPISASDENDDLGPRRLDDILRVIPRNTQTPYDVRKVIHAVCDHDSFFEIQPNYGRSMVTGLARLGGKPLLVVANQPNVLAGTITAEGANKAAHLIDMADRFNLPALFLADNPGVMSGTQAERAGTLRSAAAMFRAQTRFRHPKLHVTLRKAFGFGSSLMAMNPFDGQTLSIGLPGVMLGGMPTRGGDQAARMDEETARKMQALEANASWSVADNMAFDEIIDPRDLRNALLTGLNSARKPQL
ncbi:acetyl-CoA carboxylase carboxyltransferase component [Litorivivens lipolytica]|uniref:Acetyl-CoA carboxylase carboxyltransferase component n=1 Tax=Litorivivens lipolytica TaxID=1524264 RepID=A0A7W4W2N9_9GAMM|nr:carboxyl transferase domain-containing protein [Litorivivens lipolytica]MBB3046269.1 acetyl-CoA carboxylase carboxyltransferase component [Litorivivens lipolytica]